MPNRTDKTYKPPRSKYGVRTDALGKLARTVDGVTFDSLKEARRYCDLKILERKGEIQNLELQPKFPFDVNGVRIGVYTADFRFVENGQTVIEDVKSEPTKTRSYKINLRLLKAIYGIEIREV